MVFSDFVTAKFFMHRGDLMLKIAVENLRYQCLSNRRTESNLFGHKIKMMTRTLQAPGAKSILILFILSLCAHFCVENTHQGFKQ